MCTLRLVPWAALLALALLALGSGEDIAVVGYVPEYRFGSIDWDGVARQTTHLVLFSLEPTQSGGLDGLDRLWVVSQTNSPLQRALRRAGDGGPKVLISVGGAGRSQHFPKVAGSSKRRKQLASRLADLFQEHPVLAGVDLDWEVPQSTQQWRDLGRLAREIRSALGPGRLLTMTYHPGSVTAFSGLQSKDSGTGFVDLFDFCQCMAYSRFDEERRHSTMALAQGVVQEWIAANLPVSRMVLGMPFFGISRKNGEAASYGEIVDKDPSLLQRTEADETKSSIYFNNAKTLKSKVKMAKERGLGGVMIWELGQDKPASSDQSLLRHVWAVARGPAPGSWAHGFNDFMEALSAKIPVKEEKCFAAVTCIIGAYLMFLVLFHNPADKRRPHRPQEDPAKEDSSDAAAAAEAKPADPIPEDEQSK